MDNFGVPLNWGVINLRIPKASGLSARFRARAPCGALGTLKQHPLEDATRGGALTAATAFPEVCKSYQKDSICSSGCLSPCHTDMSLAGSQLSRLVSSQVQAVGCGNHR